jgi:hypothetical protein
VYAESCKEETQGSRPRLLQHFPSKCHSITEAKSSESSFNNVFRHEELRMGNIAGVGCECFKEASTLTTNDGLTGSKLTLWVHTPPRHPSSDP